MDRWANRPLSLQPNFAATDDTERQKFITNLRNYHACVENLDENVGRLMAFLDEQRLRENTIVVFLSDHGELGGSHGLPEKQYPYEESIGIPLIVFDPSHPEQAGRVIDDPTCTEDFFPTLLGLVGLRPREPKHGLDLSSLVRGELAGLPRVGVFLEFVAELRKGAPFYEKTWRGFRTRRAVAVLRPRERSVPIEQLDAEVPARG